MPVSQKITTNYENNIIYTETLWPKFSIWIISIIGSTVSSLIFIPISIKATFIVWFFILLVTITSLIFYTPRIEISEKFLKVGKANIEHKYLGKVSCFLGESATQARGVDLNAKAYLCIRGWVPDIVKIENIDPADPTPYWLISSKKAKKFVESMEKAALSSQNTLYKEEYRYFQKQAESDV